LFSAAKEILAATENGSRVFVTDSTAMARVDCGSLNKIGGVGFEGVWAEVRGKRRPATSDSISKTTNAKKEYQREFNRLRMLIINEAGKGWGYATCPLNLSLNLDQSR
jgi:hypothetical protein